MTSKLEHVFISCAADPDGVLCPAAGVWADTSEEAAGRRVRALNANDSHLIAMNLHATVVGSFVRRVPRRKRTERSEAR